MVEHTDGRIAVRQWQPMENLIGSVTEFRNAYRLVLGNCVET